MPMEKTTGRAPRPTALDVGRIGRPPVEPQIKRFAKPARRRLRKLVKSSPRFGDLLFSFPAAAYAIAVGGPGVAARAAGVAAVKGGASLAAVAEALGLPIWYRRLPPEAFEGQVRTPNAGLDLARCVANVAPSGPTAALWLEAVVRASWAADEMVAGWLAKQSIWGDQPSPAYRVAPMVAAYAWHSRRPDHPSRRLMDRPWAKGMSFRNAATEARVWLERVALRRCAEDDAASLSWSRPQRVSGYVIQPLQLGDLAAEAQRMGNCLATYLSFAERGGCLLFAVRRGKQSVASIELRPHASAVGKARLVQLEGPGNTAAPDRVRAAVEKWLTRQGPFPLAVGGALISRPVNAERWAAFWAEYVEAVGAEAAGVFAEPPTLRSLRRIGAAFSALERI